MNHSVVVSDVFEKTLYSIAVRKRYCRNVSVSNDGMVAILSDMDCFVLNPYTKDVFYLSINSNPEIEDDELKSKNKKKQVLLEDSLDDVGSNSISRFVKWKRKSHTCLVSVGSQRVWRFFKSAFTHSRSVSGDTDMDISILFSSKANGSPM